MMPSGRAKRRTLFTWLPMFGYDLKSGKNTVCWLETVTVLSYQSGGWGCDLDTWSHIFLEPEDK